MPIYEYACRSCEHRFETIQKARDPVLTDCPACGEAALRKLLSAPVFRLKGGGWYETDFKTGDRKNVVGNGESDKSESKAGDDKTGSADSAEATSKKAGDSKTKGAKTTDSKSASNTAGHAAQAD